MAKSGFGGKRPAWLGSWLLFVAFGILVFLATHYGVRKSREAATSVSTSFSLEDTTSRLAQQLSDTLYFAPLNSLAVLARSCGEGPTKAESVAQSWLASHPSAFCVTMWYPGQRWPVRVLSQRFWARINDLALGEAEQTTLLAWLFERERPRQPSPLMQYRVKDLRLTRLVFLPESGPEAIEVKNEIGACLDGLAARLPADHACTLLDETGKSVWTVGAPAPNPSTLPAGGVLKTPTQWWAHQAVAEGAWQLIYGTPPAVTVKPSNAFPIWLLAGGILVLVLAGLLASWVQMMVFKPVRDLAEAATELAQGQFDEPLPPAANRHLDQLIRLFNYMAGEMDRFQGINVHEIMHDKTKTETMLRNIADGVLVTDHQDRIVILNAAAEQWFGVKDSESAGALISQHIKDSALLGLIRKVRTEREVQTGEFELDVPGQRRRRIYQAHAAPLETDDGRGTGVVTAIRDITKEKEADQIKTELVSMVAHELKSPLTSIYGFSELLLDSSRLDEKGKEYAQVILNESNRLTELINKFLDLSRLESGKTEIRKLPFDLGQLVEKVAEVHAGQAARKKIRVITQVPGNLPLASGDMDLIEQVLVNLFSNAVKYSPAHSKIGIEVKGEGEMLAVSIIDNGYGIPKEALPHIFDKFYRVSDNADMEDTEGSGLGLTLAREIIEQHGGTIRVSSRLGVGSVFTFLIPKAEIDPSWLGFEV